VQLWNVAHMNEEEFPGEVVDALGEFVDANKWSVDIISTKKKEKKRVLELPEQLTSQENIMSK
jgi:hypothetical protein